MIIFNAEQEKRVRQIEIEQLMDMDIISLADVVQDPTAFFVPTSGKGSEKIHSSKSAFFTLVTFLPRPELEGLENYLALTSPSLYLEIVGQRGQARIDAVQAQLGPIDDDEIDPPTTKTMEEMRGELDQLRRRIQDIWEEHALIPTIPGRLPPRIDKIISFPSSLPVNVLPVFWQLSSAETSLNNKIGDMELEASNRSKSKRQSHLINLLGLCLLVLAAYAVWKLL